MATEFAGDLEAFNQFVAQHLDARHIGLTLEESLAAYRAHQDDLQRLRANLHPSIAQAERGESQPLHVEAILKRAVEPDGGVR